MLCSSFWMVNLHFHHVNSPYHTDKFAPFTAVYITSVFNFYFQLFYFIACYYYVHTFNSY